MSDPVDSENNLNKETFASEFIEVKCEPHGRDEEPNVDPLDHIGNKKNLKMETCDSDIIECKSEPLGSEEKTTTDIFVKTDFENEGTPNFAENILIKEEPFEFEEPAEVMESKLPTSFFYSLEKSRNYLIPGDEQESEAEMDGDEDDQDDLETDDIHDPNFTLDDSQYSSDDDYQPSNSTKRRRVSLAARLIEEDESFEDDDQPSTSTKRRRDDGELLVTFNSATVKSNSGYTWHTRPQVAAARRTPARNIVVSSRPGPTQAASQYTTPEECFDLFMSTAIVDLIVDFTNKKIDDVATKCKRKTATVQHTTAAEIRALLGVLIFSGYRKDNHLNTRELWCSEVGALFYKAAMSEVRFNFLLYCLRFDDMGTREQRRATDKFAPVREMWDMFMANCEDNYTPHENLTVDEQLLAFRGKCPFRMYIPNKPAKYGIKIVMVNDVQSKYLLKAIPYLGKAGTTTRHGLTLGHMFTKDLTSRYQNTNRNVTTDNWFTSVPLIQDLLTNGLTLVGTVRANKPEIPPVMREKKDRRPGSSAFLFTDDLTLVSYVPNTQTTKKNVLLLSSMHTQQVVNDVTEKPNIIEYYNETKGGVDTFDQMCATYNCSRKTNRWPLCVFFGMVNASIINSWIIYKANNPTLQRKELHRRKFMHGLALQLIKPSAQERMNNPSQHRQVKLAIRQVCSLNLRSGTAAGAGPSAAEMRNPMVRCTKCDSKADKKTRFRCHSCRQPVCPSHYFPYCCDCI